MFVSNYRVKAQGKVKWRSYDTVRLEISVGNTYHEGAKLEATLEWAKHHFDRRIIILCDTPQRYNIMFEGNFSEDEAYNMALVKGDIWLQQYRPLLDGFEITRWDDWKNKSIYRSTYEDVLKLYRSDPDFFNALQHAIHTIWNRKNFAPEHKERFFSHSEKYLLEETATFSIAYDDLGGVSAYPGNFLELFEMFIDSQRSDIPIGLTKAHCTRINFRRTKTVV